MKDLRRDRRGELGFLYLPFVLMIVVVVAFVIIVIALPGVFTRMPNSPVPTCIASGTVRFVAGPVYGAIVRVVGTDLWAGADGQGAYRLGGAPCTLVTMSADAPAVAGYHGPCATQTRIVQLVQGGTDGFSYTNVNWILSCS